MVFVSAESKVSFNDSTDAPFEMLIEPASSVFRTPLLVKSNTESSPESSNLPPWISKVALSTRNFLATERVESSPT